MKSGYTKVTLGLSSPLACRDLKGPLNGDVWLSVHGFLNFLETRLGVSKPEVSFTSRLVDYLNCLEQVKSEVLFFYESYQADPFAVARKLLLWRDELYMAGWTGTYKNPDTLSQRLQDLEVVEKVAHAQVAQNSGQRWQYVLSRLATDKVFISDICLMDALEFFPPLVQRTLEATGSKISKPPAADEEQAEPATDLYKIQSVLYGKKTPPEIKNDGSLILIETDDLASVAATTAHIIAQSLKNPATPSPLVIAESNGHILDEHLENIGVPRAGFSENSPWRPVFQVLPLTLDLMWAPVNPRKMLQFLTNPLCPLPNSIRFPLGNLVADKPGIGGPNWRDTVDGILEKSPDEPARKKILAEIGFWLECDRFDTTTGIPTDIIQTRIAAVSTWLGKQMAISKDPNKQALFATAKGQAEDLSLAVLRLEKYNDGHLNRADLSRLFDDIRGVGAALADRSAEIAVKTAPLSAVKESGGVFEQQSEIIWAGLTGDTYLGGPFITDAERQSLSEQNIRFIQETDLLASLREGRLRPVLMSKDRLILISPKGRTADHPVWTRVITAFPDLTIHSERSALNLLGVMRTQVQALTLPPKQREWQLPKTTKIPDAKSTSYSSLDKFLFKPHQWVLSYSAKIRSGSLSLANDGNRLKGNLAHRLIETYLDAHPDLQAVDLGMIEKWSKPELERLIIEEGATLLEEGAFKDHVEFTTTMERSLRALITHLVNAGISTTETEKHLTASFTGGALEGSIDILATNSKGDKAIIDVKYGSAKYRREELQNSQYLQLATYDRLTGAKPHLSYFIITDACMLNLSHSFFAAGETITPDLGLSLDEYWKNIEVIWDHRRKLYDAGTVEVPVEGTEPTSNSVPAGIVLAMPEPDERFSDFTALTGWGVGE